MIAPGIIKPGDVVTANHGGPKMTVERIVAGDLPGNPTGRDACDVVWFNKDDDFQAARIHTAALKVVAGEGEKAAVKPVWLPNPDLL